MIIDSDFAHGVARFDDDGAKRDTTGIVDARVVDGDTEETGRADGFDARIDFFERTADGFLALVDAKDDLRGEAVGFRHRIRHRAMFRERDEDAALMTALVGEVQQAAALESMLRSGAADQALQNLLVDLEDDIADLTGKLSARLPAERADGAAAQPDMSQLPVAVDRLGEMLSDADAESLDFFHRHQALFKAAWPEGYGSIRDAVENFDFELALVEMRAAMERRGGKVLP